jgi:hypothetical protein
VLAGLVLAVPMGIAWAAGRAARTRRDQRRNREESGVASVTALAGLRAGAERARIAEGLRAAVLRPAAALPQAADRGDLDGVLTAARLALTAMRSLLDNLAPRPAIPPSAPPAPGAPPSSLGPSVPAGTTGGVTGSDQEVSSSGCG